MYPYGHKIHRTNSVSAQQLYTKAKQHLPMQEVTSLPSLRRNPSAPVRLALSEPAKSTK
jgi:hypothetical protein